MKILQSSINYQTHNYSSCSFKQLPHQYKKSQAKAIALGVISLLGASCAGLKGGNFVYDDKNTRIASFASYKAEYNLIGEDTFYNADSLEIENIKVTPNEKVIPTKDKYILEYFKKSDIATKPNIFSINYLKSINLNKWMDENKKQLIGSCIFTKKDNNIISNIIAGMTKGSSYENEFIPSHVGTIFEKDGELKVLNVLAPKATVSDLRDIINTYKGKLVLCLRNFNINTERFSNEIAKYEGIKYGFLSAFQTIFEKIEIKEGFHCSEVHFLELQKEGLFKGINANKITPNTLLRLLVNENFKK